MQSCRTFRCSRRFPIVVILILIATIASYAATGNDEKPVAISASVWSPPQDGGPLELAQFDRAGATTATVSDDTRLEGVCVHCNLALQCRAGDLANRCSVCPCERTNFMCLGGKPSEGKNWAALLRSLPRGTAMRAVFLEAAGPERAIQRLTIDRHAALLPVEGLASATARQLDELGKSVRAVRVARNSEGDRIEIHLKENWSDDKVKRLEKALSEMGARLAPMPAKPAAL